MTNKLTISLNVYKGTAPTLIGDLIMEQKAKFQIGDILPIAITLVVAGIAITFGLSVQEDVQDDMTAASAAYNASSEAIDGVSTLAEKLPLIATVVAAAIIIGVLLRYLMMR